jgi:8-oxo-dGTP pyrophosphatase MutT (NUDIX family)
MATTYDGLPVAEEPPFGAAILVHRESADGLEFLILHRAHQGPDFEGDWAWTPPSGSRFPGEALEVCAARELMEEAGLALPLTLSPHGSAEWPVFVAEAPADAAIVLDGEHDRYEWLPLDAAVARCLPPVVSAPLAAFAEARCSRTAGAAGAAG